MPRINTVSWSQAETITRRMSALQIELMKWHKCYHPVGSKHILGGDSMVIVEAITLRKYLDAIIENSSKANLDGGKK
jgi:hypothetical protein